VKNITIKARRQPPVAEGHRLDAEECPEPGQEAGGHAVRHSLDYTFETTEATLVGRRGGAGRGPLAVYPLLSRLVRC
jgi:hypothetical protein